MRICPQIIRCRELVSGLRIRLRGTVELLLEEESRSLSADLLHDLLLLERVYLRVGPLPRTLRSRGFCNGDSLDRLCFLKADLLRNELLDLFLLRFRVLFLLQLREHGFLGLEERPAVPSPLTSAGMLSASLSVGVAIPPFTRLPTDALPGFRSDAESLCLELLLEIERDLR